MRYNTKRPAYTQCCYSCVLLPRSMRPSFRSRRDEIDVTTGTETRFSNSAPESEEKKRKDTRHTHPSRNPFFFRVFLFFSSDSRCGVFSPRECFPGPPLNSRAAYCQFSRSKSKSSKSPSISDTTITLPIPHPPSPAVA